MKQPVLLTYNLRGERAAKIRMVAMRFRVRLRDGGALLQFTAKQQENAQAELEKIKAELSKYFGNIKLDPKARAESQ